MPKLTYELAVIGLDVADVVQSAGGWMCDRVRAGWQVSVLVPVGSDTLPLQILGVETLEFETDFETVRTSSPAALAMPWAILDTDERVRRYVRKSLSRGNTEVTFWGQPAPGDVDRQIDHVGHRLSAVAQAFKTHALIASSAAARRADPTEEFYSAALWYPPNCADLAPINLISRSTT